MSLRPQFLITAALITMLSASTILLLLTLLDHRLDLLSVQHFDLAIQARVHALSSPTLTRVMLAFTWIGSIKIFATALAIAIVWLLFRDGLHDAVLLGMAITGAFILNQTLKVHFHRLRPQVPWSIGDEHTFSFPSGHSLFAVVFYGTLAWCALHRHTDTRRRFAILIPAILMMFSIGTSRIYLGMHYPTDVAAGWMTGALWLSAIIAIDLQWHHQIASATHPSPPLR